MDRNQRIKIRKTVRRPRRILMIPVNHKELRYMKNLPGHAHTEEVMCIALFYFSSIAGFTLAGIPVNFHKKYMKNRKIKAKLCELYRNFRS